MTAPPSEISSVPAPAPLAGPHGVRPGARRRETPEAVRPGDHDRPESAAPDVCVIVPTRNERGNVAPLIDRLGRALAGHAAEILFVDDSDDETPAGARSAQGGLGGAVLAGIQATDAAWVVVMDGNLQHPPEVVPELLHEGEEFDIVVASRYCGDGAADRLRSRYRELVSSSASAVARLAFPRRLARVTDPLSGFFAVRVAALDAASLRPQGFKILLEILRRSPRWVSWFRFAAREQDKSDASWREAARFIRRRPCPTGCP